MRHIVLTSLKRDGRLEINIPLGGFEIYEDIKLQKAVSEFKSAFNDDNKHFPKFIKIELITLISKFDRDIRLISLLRKLNDIIYVSSQNFEIYLQDLSLENLKKDFIEHKNKYFSQLREVLSKLTNQIIGLPITITAAAFSTYKVSDSQSTLLLILGAFFIYSLYTVFLLKLQKEDIQDIKMSFLYDFNKIKESAFFIKFPEEINDFKKTRSNLNLRICSLITAIDLYYLFFTLSTIAFAINVEIQLGIRLSGLISTFILLSFSFIIIYILNQTIIKEHR